MKPLLMKILRGIRDLLRTMGLDIRSLRARKHWRSGLEIAWRGDDLERVFIVAVDSFDTPVRFLVRNPKDYIQEHMLGGRFYAESELNRVREHYKGRTFLDIGANVGNHSLFAAMILGAPRVIAIEPNPAAFRILRCNIALNDLGGVVEHLPIGLASGAGRAELHDMPESLGLASLEAADDGTVELHSGDEICAGEDIGYIKVDTEGMEIDVLKGLERTIDRCRPDMLVEVDEVNLDAFGEICARWGYEPVETANYYAANTYFWISPKTVSLN